MKTKKLNLNDLKIDSFITSLEGKREETLKGGARDPMSPLGTAPQICGCSPWLSLETNDRRCEDLSIVLPKAI